MKTYVNSPKQNIDIIFGYWGKFRTGIQTRRDEAYQYLANRYLDAQGKGINLSIYYHKIYTQ